MSLARGKGGSFLMTKDLSEQIDLSMRRSLEFLWGARVVFDADLWALTIFMCHQTLEMFAKGQFMRLLDRSPPYKHSVYKLMKAVCDELGLELDEGRSAFLTYITVAYGLARYRTGFPLSQEIARETLAKTEEMLAWVATTSR
jgi:HEPN domain-containing protein